MAGTLVVGMSSLSSEGGGVVTAAEARGGNLRCSAKPKTRHVGKHIGRGEANAEQRKYGGTHAAQRIVGGVRSLS